MVTLYIDCAKQNLITVKILRNGKNIFSVDEKQSFGSQVLLGLIHKGLKKTTLKFEDLEEIKINPGPGSFTGLKVGASVAQALGFSLNIPVNGKINKPIQLKYT